MAPKRKFAPGRRLARKSKAAKPQAKKKSAPRRRKDPATTSEMKRRSFRMADVDYAIVKRAADADGMPVAEWIRQTLLAAARGAK